MGHKLNEFLAAKMHKTLKREFLLVPFVPFCGKVLSLPPHGQGNNSIMDHSAELLHLMIQPLKSGFIAPVFGLFEENRYNCLTMNILHKIGRLFNQGQSSSIKVNRG
jgi:hypothetical protein